MSQDSLISYELSHEDGHNASCALLQFIQEEGIPPEIAIPALLMTVGRLCSPKILEAEDEVKFVQTISEFLGMYFLEGVLN